MNKAFFLLTFFIANPLCAMDGKEDSEKWKQIALRDLRNEAGCIVINRAAKIEFIKEQQKRFDEAWCLIRRLSFKCPYAIKIARDLEIIMNGNTILMSKDKEDYTAHDIDALLEYAHQIREHYEQSQNPSN